VPELLGAAQPARHAYHFQRAARGVEQRQRARGVAGFAAPDLHGKFPNQ